MKPVIITLNSDGNVVMSVDEFKRHMDSAYNQGLSDGGMTISYPYNPNQWWYNVNPITTNEAESITLTGECLNAKTSNGTVGAIGLNGVANATSIKDYIKSKGE